MMKQLPWFVGAFAITLAICLVGWGVITFQTVTPGGGVTKTVDSLLLDLDIPTTDITEAESGQPMFLSEGSLSEAEVILLGGIGCSRDQVEVLHSWKNETTDTTRQKIIALYADPLMGVELSRHESSLLRRASGIDFPSLVYEAEEFNLRAMGVRTPQTVHFQDGVIVEVLPPKRYPKMHK